MWSDHILMLMAREKQAQYLEEARQARLLKQLRQNQPPPAMRLPRLFSKIASLLRRRIPPAVQLNAPQERPHWTKAR